MVEHRGSGEGVPRVAASIADARRRLARRKRYEDPAPTLPRGPDNIVPPKWPGQPPNWSANDLGLPANPGCECPVRPIGIEHDVKYLVDSAGTFRAMKASEFTHSGLQDLFALTPNYPQFAWPRYGKIKIDADGDPVPPPITSFHDDSVRSALFYACAQMGQFSPDNKLRGRGAWQLRGGGLIYHAGEELWHGEVRDGQVFLRAEETGMVEGQLYPLMPEIPAPWDQWKTLGDCERDNPAGDLLKTLRCWRFKKPRVDPVLLLGFVGVSYLSGALDWRSGIVLLGDKGTGKSFLQMGLQSLFGDALFRSGDASAAGIRQMMRHDARPVAVDEAENEADNLRRIKDIIRMMRAASSGDKSYRGGADHQPVEFQLRSAFLLAAINNPVQSSQDLSRVAILRLEQLARGQPLPPPIDADTCGRKLLARLMLMWPRFAELYAEYARALDAGGHDARGQKTYGTLLACADLLLGAELAAELDVPLTENLAFWTDELAADRLPEIEDAAPNWRLCLTHLLTVPTELRRHGAQVTVGKILADLRGGAGATRDAGDGAYDFNQAQNDLALIGLGLVVPGDRAPQVFGPLLAVPNTSAALTRLFEGTAWAGAIGAGGPWKDALRQAPYFGNTHDGERGIVISDRELNRVTIAGVSVRCTLVVLKNFHEAPER